jgi:hypothetical protein
MESGTLNFPEPAGPLQACNGAYCFTFTFFKFFYILGAGISQSA